MPGKCHEWCPRGGAFGYDIDRALNVAMGLQSDYSDCVSLHAEQNALMFGDRATREGGTIYVSSGVCSTCAKLIANSGLEQVVMMHSGNAAHRDTERWVEFMEECGLTVVIL
jgi:deoxycytidylate deaminase